MRQSWYHRQTTCRIRHKFQVDKRRLNRRVPQPAGQVIDRNTVHQQVPSVTVAQRVGADPLPWRNRAQFLSAFHRSLHLAPGSRGVSLHYSALRAGRCSDDGVHLVCFEVLRYALFAFGSCAVLCFEVTAMIPYGPSGIGSDPWGNWLRCLPGDLSIRSRVPIKLMSP